MDTVILAAGKGERLDGITAPYLKPLLVVNAKPIVQLAVDFALQLGGAPIVVVAPENASPISHVLGDRSVKMIVQRRPEGPGLALATGLQLAGAGRAMVLMGDNVFTWLDVQRVADAQRYGIGVQYVDREDASRYTYWRHTAAQWVEKVVPSDEDLDPACGMATAWVGPLVVDRDTALGYYRSPSRETGIGPVLDRLVPANNSHTAVAVTTYDIGVPEAL